MKKSLVSLLLALLLVLSSTCAFAIYDVPEAYDLPIGDGTETLSIYMAMEKGSEKAMLTYDTHTAVLEWAKRTGLNFTFVHPPENDDGSYFMTTIASMVLPDMWATGNWSTYYAGGVEGAIKDKILVDLNPMIEKYGYHYLTEAHKNWDAQATRNFMTDEGMYRFGAASQRVPVLGMQHTGMVVREDLLDKLGIDVPETIDQVHDMLVAFKNDGVEIPLALEKLTSSYYYDGDFLASWLGVTTNKFMIGEDGKVTYSMLEPAYKDYLAMLKQWYSEGLIDVDCVSRVHADAKAMVTSGRSAMVAIGNWETQECIAVGKSACGEDFNLIGLTAPVKNEEAIGTKNHFARPIENGGNTMYWGVSTTCKIPEKAFKAFDWLYSYEGTELMVFGVNECVDQLHPEKNEIVQIHWTNDDGTRQFSDYILHNPELEYNSIRYVYTIQNLSSEYASEMEYMQYGAECNAQCWEAWTANADSERHVPSNISLTADESTKQVTTMNEIETFIYDKIYQIVFGEDTVDNWDGYVEQLHQMGIDDVIAIQQAATDRYYAR